MRFKHIAPMVTSLELGYALSLAATAELLVMGGKHNALPLFPNLVELLGSELPGMSNEVFYTTTLLVGPNLRQATMLLETPTENDQPRIDIFNHIGTTTFKLQRFILEFKDPSPETVDALSQCLRQLELLESVELGIYDGEFDATPIFDALERKVYLTLFSLAAPQSASREGFPNSPTPFAALEDFEYVTNSHQSSASIVRRLARGGRLKKLMIRPPGSGTTLNAEDLIKAISQHQNLRVLELHASAGESPFSFDTLGRLQACKCLTSLIVHISGAWTMSDANITSLARGLPCLQDLNIGYAQYMDPIPFPVDLPPDQDVVPTLQSLVELCHHCPDLSLVAIPLDARTGWSSSPEKRHNALTTVFIRDPALLHHDLLAVAAFFHRLSARPDLWLGHNPCTSGQPANSDWSKVCELVDVASDGDMKKETKG